MLDMPTEASEEKVSEEMSLDDSRVATIGTFQNTSDSAEVPCDRLELHQLVFYSTSRFWNREPSETPRLLEKKRLGAGGSRRIL